MSRTIGRRAYAEMFGPTVGDRVRLADTGLIVEVEEDHTLKAGGYGEEVKFGGGKDAFIGGVHRIAARIDDQFELVAGALSSTPEKARESGRASARVQTWVRTAPERSRS